MRAFCIIIISCFLVPTLLGAETTFVRDTFLQKRDTVRQKERVLINDTADYSKRSLLTRLLVKSLVVEDRRKAVENARARHNLRHDYFDEYSGRRIVDIEVVRGNVFDTASRVWAEQTLNKMHYVTRESRINRDLLFKVGDTINSDLLMNNEQLIQSRPYISDVRIDVVPDPADTMNVKVVVYTRDSWTITVDGYIRGSGKTKLDLYDRNILGSGDAVRIGTSFYWRNGGYGGNMLEYSMPNIRGSFFSGRVVAGKSFSDYEYGLEVEKEFIVPKDYMAGASFLFQKEEIELIPEDSMFRVGWRSYDVWTGISRPMRVWDNSWYLTLRFYNEYFYDRPDVSERLNPYFHNNSMTIGNFGFYKERFTPETMIYGYGHREYLASGYNVGFVGGFNWSEFDNAWYLGLQYSAGKMFNFGYLKGFGQIGSYINTDNGKFRQSMFHVGLNYFTPLSRKARYRVRQFINCDLLRGWNRVYGYHEMVGFRTDADIRGLKERVFGENRFLINAETVVFTPWHIYQFKIATFFYTDMGFLGNRGNVFKNDFFATIGLGVRIKNERLIFRNISIRLGLALKSGGIAKGQYFRLSNEERYNRLRYIPAKAEMFPYE